MTMQDANDLERILATTNTDTESLVHAVKDNADAIFRPAHGPARRHGGQARLAARELD